MAILASDWSDEDNTGLLLVQRLPSASELESVGGSGPSGWSSDSKTNLNCENCSYWNSEHLNRARQWSRSVSQGSGHWGDGVINIVSRGPVYFV